MTTSKIFLILYNNLGQYVSGEEIGKTLNVSRAYISKGISKLKKCGLNIKSATNNGHCLEDFDDIWCKETIDGLTDKNFLFLDEVDSSNTYAKKIILQNYDGVAAKKQSGGKGRRGRAFVSVEGGLYFSYILRRGDNFKIMAHQSMLINLAAALAVYETLKKAGVKAFIKYPNDILVNGKKICGILTEGMSDGDFLEWAIIGIGVNINNEIPQELKDIAVNLKTAADKKFNRAEIMADIIRNFDNLIKNPSLIKDKYRQTAEFFGKEIKLIYEDKTKIVTAVGIDNDGYLLVNDGGEILRPVGCDVSVRF